MPIQATLPVAPAGIRAVDVPTPPSSPAVVRAVRTQLTGGQAAEALKSAFSAVTGRPASKETVAVLSAQWAHETGRGASMYNFNFGGLKGTGPSGLSVAQKTREGWGDSERTIVDRFRAYGSAEEGATDYVRLLKQRYPKALEAAERGDSQGFVRGLKERGYFTGNEGAYIRSVSSMAELALKDGPDALGRGGPPAPMHLSAPRSVPARSAGFDEPLPLSEVAAPFVDSLAIADEIGRTALRIIAQDARDRRSQDQQWNLG
ncbi:MAG: glucosaminidase domain-containing protein [Myxococcales bacterium]|nr:glucosaminidase domain-containing protein [Myxococcales bacterium]MCB9579373.1 glucosaminidase domain-containing protein [Polyangiaceae bacterium]